MRESSADRLTESDISCVVKDCRRLFRQADEGLDEPKIGSVDRLMCEGRVQLIRRFLEILPASADERFLPTNCPCPSCGTGRLKSPSFRRKLIDTALGLMVIRWRRYACDNATCLVGAVYPRDLELSLQRDHATPETRRLFSQAPPSRRFGAFGNTTTRTRSSNTVASAPSSRWIGREILNPRRVVRLRC